MYYGLLYVHSQKNLANEYLDYQWYDHIDTLKNEPLYDVTSQDKCIML